MQVFGLAAKLRILSMTIFGFITALLLLIIFLPTLALLFIVSQCVFLFIKLKLGNTFTRPGGLDILQGMESFRSRPYIIATARYEGNVDSNFVRKKFIKLIYDERGEDGEPRFRRLRQVLQKTYGYHIFRDAPDFDIKNHIKDVWMKDLFPEKFGKKIQTNGFPRKGAYPNSVNSANINGKIQEHYPSNGLREFEVSDNSFPEIHAQTKVSWEKLMQRVLDRYGCKPIRQGQPQWEVFVVNEEDQEHTTLILKINHGYTDGVYFLRFFLEYVGDHSVTCFLPYTYHKPSFMRRVLHGLWAFSLLPFGIARLSFDYENSPLHGPQLSGEKMYLVSKPFDLSVLKEVKKATKVSMNSIFFSCMSNAVATHFMKKNCTVPHIIALVPISLQDMERPVKLKNRFVLKGILVPTFLDKNSNNLASRSPQSPIDRLHIVQDWISKTQADPSFLAIHWLVVALCSLLPSDLLAAVWRSKGLTTTLSNLAGPQDEDPYMDGARNTEFAFWIPDRNPLGMGVSVAGFRGKIRIGLMIDKIFINDDKEGYEFLDAFIAEVHNLHNSVMSKKLFQIPDDLEFSKLINRDIP